MKELEDFRINLRAYLSPYNDYKTYQNLQALMRSCKKLCEVTMQEPYAQEMYEYIRKSYTSGTQLSEQRLRYHLSRVSKKIKKKGNN